MKDGPNQGLTELQTFFQSLKDRDTEDSIEFEESVIAEFCQLLGYDQENIYFHVPYQVQQDVFIADSVISENQSAEPWLVVEAVQYTDSSYPNVSEGIDPMIFDSLHRAIAVTGADRAVLLSNRAVGGVTEDGDVWLDLDDFTIENTRDFCKYFTPPETYPSDGPADLDLPTVIETDNYNISLLEFQSKYSKVQRSESNNAKKEALEDLAAMILEGVPHFRVRERNYHTTTSEIDLIVENENIHSALNSHSRYILVECKNWAEPVGAKEIRDFSGKINRAQSNSGILFVKEGISGQYSDQDGGAAGEINQIFLNEGNSIVVFGEQELNLIRKGVSFYKLLDEKLFDLRFGH